MFRDNSAMISSNLPGRTPGQKFTEAIYIFSRAPGAFFQIVLSRVYSDLRLGKLFRGTLVLIPSDFELGKGIHGRKTVVENNRKSVSLSIDALHRTFTRMTGSRRCFERLVSTFVALRRVVWQSRIGPDQTTHADRKTPSLCWDGFQTRGE